MSRRRSAVPSLFRPFVGDRRGATTIEFAICAAAFFTLVVGSLQIVIVFFVQQIIQTAVETVAREVLTGQLPNGTTREQFRTRACKQLPVFLKCSNLYADVQKVPDLSGIGSVGTGVTFDAAGRVTSDTQFDPGSAGDVVVLRLIYAWPIGTAPLGLNLSNQSDGSRTIVGTMVFKSEPYL